MTFTIPVAAAVLLFSATVAQANPTTTSTDEARAMAGRVLPPDELATVSATPARYPMTTDEARALVGKSLPRSSPQVLVGTENGLTTDQARALAGGAIRAPSLTMPVESTMACAQACSCKHG